VPPSRGSLRQRLESPGAVLVCTRVVRRAHPSRRWFCFGLPRAGTQVLPGNRIIVAGGERGNGTINKLAM
jgi:hypothetical protein